MNAMVRYLPRLAADYLLTRGGMVLAVGVALLLPVLVTTRIASPEVVTPEFLRTALGSFLQNVLTFLVLVAAAGLVGNDVRQGFYRLLFAKPVSPTSYYAAAFGVMLTGVFVVMLLLTGLYALVATPVWPGRALADVMVRALLLGGLVFAFSRFTRLDWLLGFFVLLLGGLLRTQFPRDESAAGAVLHVLLPPDLPASLFPAAGPLWGPIAWAVGYGLLGLGAGLAAVRFVPLGAGR
jgi:hypothetical protein